MGKVKDEQKLSNAAVQVNRKRKKRKKELDLLRRNVLEAKRKLRQKTAPPKTHVSTFNKVLNSFAERRQANDNKTQGFDSTGKRAGLKKMCNRLLPSRKPQVGIFANGSKGAEIKRANCTLNDLDRARLEGDLQKVLNDGKRRCTESKFDALNTILHRPSPETIDTEQQESSRILVEKLERNSVQNHVAERQCGKRKLKVPIELDDKIPKKKYTEARKDMVVLEAAKPGVAERSNSTDKKWMKSLFADEECDSVSISEPAYAEELRFTPKIITSGARARFSERKESLYPSQKILSMKRLNFKYGQLGRLAPSRYEELCGLVCTENFGTCLRGIPHIDPLAKVKQSLLDVYADTLSSKFVEHKVRLRMAPPGDSSTSGSHPVHSNIQKSKYFRDGVNVLPPQGVDSDPINPKNFPRWKATEKLPAENKALMEKAEVKLSKNIPRVSRGPSSSETSITEPNTSSLDVNYDSSRQSLKSEYSKVDTEAMPSGENLDNTFRLNFAGIPSTRKNIMWRYLNEENNPEPLNEVGSIYPTHGSAVSAENDNVQKCYFPDPSKGCEMQNKKNRRAPERKLDEICDPTLSKGGIAESTAKSGDANSDKVIPYLGLGLGKFTNINRKSRPTIVNLGSASNSMLDRIPTNRKETIQRYLKDANNPQFSEKSSTMLPPEGILYVAEDDKPKKRHLGDPLRRHKIKSTLFDVPSKNERHVPSILRKSHASKGKNTSNTAGTVLARGFLEIGNIRLKTSNFNFEEVTSGGDGTVFNDLPNNKGNFKKLAATSSQFPVASKHLTNPDHFEPLINVSPNMQFMKRAGLFEPATGVNAIYDTADNGSNEKINFADFGFTPEVATTRRNTANPSDGSNLSEAFNQPPITYRQQYSSDNVGVINLNNTRQPLNLPIFHHHHRPDANLYKAVYDEKHISSKDQPSRRFPVLLKRENATVAQNETCHERQQGRQLPDFNEPKVIILQNPSRRGAGDEVRCEINGPDLPYRNNGEHVQQHGAGFTFAAIPRCMTTAPMKTVYSHNCKNVHAPDATYRNVGAGGEHLQVRQIECKNDLKNVKVPLSMFQNDVQNVVSHKHIVPEHRRNPMTFFKPSPVDIQTSQKMFQRASASNAQLSGSYQLAYSAGNANAEIQHNCSSTPEPLQFYDGRVGFVRPKNDSDPFCQTAINPPIKSDRMVHRQTHFPVSSEDINCNSEYFIDPRCPPAGYKWNQIDQSGAQVHQHVIQPIYNVTDAYCPQGPRHYYPSDS